MNISITVTYNPDISCLNSQLHSLRNEVDSSIIVDNGSKNIDEIEQLVSHFNIQLIKLDRNMGLSHAQNIGVENAISLGAKYLLLLDQDSILNEGFISSMMSVYVENNVGILGPSFFDPLNNEFYWGTNYIGPFIKRVSIKEITDVTYVIASGSFFAAEIFTTVGKMEEGLFVDYIDVEWSLRAKKLGYRVAMTNKASMAHTIGDSRLNLFGRKISIHSPMRRYYLVRNSFYMLRLNYVPFGYKVREIFLNVVRSLISLSYSQNKKETLIKIAEGICDGLRNKYGSYNDR